MHRWFHRKTASVTHRELDREKRHGRSRRGGRRTRREKNTNGEKVAQGEGRRKVTDKREREETKRIAERKKEMSRGQRGHGCFPEEYGLHKYGFPLHERLGIFLFLHT